MRMLCFNPSHNDCHTVTFSKRFVVFLCHIRLHENFIKGVVSLLLALSIKSFTHQHRLSIIHCGFLKTPSNLSQFDFTFYSINKHSNLSAMNLINTQPLTIPFLTLSIKLKKMLQQTLKLLRIVILSIKTLYSSAHPLLTSQLKNWIGVYETSLIVS